MKKSKFNESQIVRILGEVTAGKAVREVCKAHGLSEATYYTWKRKYAGMEMGDVKRLREAKLPSKKLLADFDFPAMPSLDPLAVHRLAGCDFVAKAQNVLLIGSSGTGKTHLATAIAIEACRRKHSVRFFTVSQLVEALIEARSERMLGRLRTKLRRVNLLVLDELGFVPLPANGAELLFDVVSDRYERGSVILTTNLPFEEWTSVLTTEALTHAMLDRLTHHVHILEMNGRSYRLAESLSSRNS